MQCHKETSSKLKISHLKCQRITSLPGWHLCRWFWFVFHLLAGVFWVSFCSLCLVQPSPWPWKAGVEMPWGGTPWLHEKNTEKPSLSVFLNTQPIIPVLSTKFEMAGSASLPVIHHSEITPERFNGLPGRGIRSNCSVMQLPWMFGEANICICKK